jgi:hypothetical protein
MSVLGLVAAVSGCQAKDDSLTYDRFRRVEPYVSTRADVVELLGEPDHRLGHNGQDAGESIWVYSRHDDHLFARIEFDGRTVSRKEWIDASRARWEDSSEGGGSAPD